MVLFTGSGHEDYHSWLGRTFDGESHLNPLQEHSHGVSTAHVIEYNLNCRSTRPVLL